MKILILALSLTVLTGCANTTAGVAVPVAAPSTPATQTPSSFELRGSLSLYGEGFAGQTCTGSGGYRDIAEGAGVTVWNSDGKLVAVSNLTEGRVILNGLTCQFRFDVEVPAGQGPYQVEVSHRGRVAFTEESAKDVVALSLGR